jgi:hypothetical protein
MDMELRRGSGHYTKKIARGCRAIGGERGSAAAGVGGIGVLEDKAAAHDFILEVDLGAVEVEVALAVGEDFDAMAFHDFIVVRPAFGEIEDIREAGATTAFYANAKGDGIGEALVFDDGLDFLGCSFREENGHRFWLQKWKFDLPTIFGGGRLGQEVSTDGREKMAIFGPFWPIRTTELKLSLNYARLFGAMRVQFPTARTQRDALCPPPQRPSKNWPARNTNGAGR